MEKRSLYRRIPHVLKNAKNESFKIEDLTFALHPLSYSSFEIMSRRTFDD